MPLNIGYIELGGGGVTVRVYYDTTFTPVGDNQPLVNGPRGYCLDVTNTTGQDLHLTISGATNNPLDVTVGQGDPVTSGNARSRTRQQMAQLGFTTRGDLGQITLE
jgi:hypothetical protein